MSLVTEDCTPGPAEQRAYMSAKCDELVRAEQRLEAAEQVGARRLPCAIQQHSMGGMQQPPGGAAVTLVASCQLSAASGGSRAGLLIASAPDAALAARRQGLLLHIPHCRQHSVNSGSATCRTLLSTTQEIWLRLSELCPVCPVCLQATSNRLRQTSMCLH